MRKVDLFNYLPLFIQEYEEMNMLLKVENEELTKEWEEIERAFNNTFIFSTDRYGISRFEKMMKIYPKENETLIERQNKVYAKWNATLPYTWRWLENYLTAYFKGTTTKGIPILFNDKYQLDVRLTSENNFGNNEYELHENLRELIPANLILKVINEKKLVGKYYLKNTVVYKIKKKIQTNSFSTNPIGKYQISSGLIYRMKKGV